MMTHQFLSAEKVINSLRFNGFNNTAYAIAELIDNSIQAEASIVNLGFIEELKSATSHNVTEISVFDNGRGMSKDTLRLAMQFGGSENRNNPNGMGRFGMGLPNSSISQCKRVEVWSWEAGKAPHFTYLDIDEMLDGKLEVVPEPVEKKIPERYGSLVFNPLPESGTLVVWKKLDRLNWKTGRSIFKHCEFIIGRLYRNFINNGSVRINSNTYRPSGKDVFSSYDSETFKVNDPMYLMKETSLPSLPGDYKGEAFFELLDEEKLPVEYEGEDGLMHTAEVVIRSSVVKKNISSAILKNSTSKLGTTIWGKHCAKNIGVSIVRSGRELGIRDSFYSKELRQYKGRFCGVEIEFPPSLDTLFGVTNNKQDAVKLIPYDLQSLAEQNGFETEQEYRRDLEQNSDSLLQVINVVSAINRHIRKAAESLKNVNVDPIKSPERDISRNENSAETRATVGSIHREESGHHAQDFNSKVSAEDLKDHLMSAGLDENESSGVIDKVLLSGSKFIIEDVARDTDAFFDVSTKKGLTLVLFNRNHVFYEKLISQLNESEREVLRTAIAGFARVMNETTDQKRLNYLNSIRREWGKVISEFLVDSDESDEF